MSHGKRHRRSLSWTALSARGRDYIPGNRISLLQNGETYFPALEAAFDQARYEIVLETYIYEDDAVGQRIADALKRAARRGVIRLSSQRLWSALSWRHFRKKKIPGGRTSRK